MLMVLLYMPIPDYSNYIIIENNNKCLLAVCYGFGIMFRCSSQNVKIR